MNKLLRAAKKKYGKSIGSLKKVKTVNDNEQLVNTLTSSSLSKQCCAIEDCKSSTGTTTSSSNRSDERNPDPEMDRLIMRTIVEIKHTKHRPKFTVFSEINFQRECLDAHNILRLHHECHPLLWSQELGDLAKNWAKKLCEKGRILYPELPGIGENISLSRSSHNEQLPSGVQVAKQWEREQEQFNFDTPKWQFNCQHFTQMIWRESEEFGVARCWNNSQGLVAVVALYRPGGNSNGPGDFLANVPSKSPSSLHFTTTDGRNDRPFSAPLDRRSTPSRGVVRSTTADGHCRL